MSSLFGGSASYEVEETPEKQATKSLSAGANAASQAQKDKAKKTRGLSASILTNRSGSAGLTSNATGSTTLG